MKFFGPSQGEVWKKLSEEIDGEFTVIDGLRKTYEVRKKFKDWEIVLDKYSSGERYIPTCTRVYASFYNKHGLRFKIFDEYFRNYFNSFFGMQDISIDQSGFSREFIIRSNSQIAMKRLFQNDCIRELMNTEEDILFEIKGVDYFEVNPKENTNIEIKTCGVIKDTEFLKNMFELIAACLLEIEKINDEYEKLDVNDFSKFSVMKNSIKNVLAENVSYDQLKEKFSSKMKHLKNKLKDQEVNTDTNEYLTEPVDEEKIEKVMPVKEELDDIKIEEDHDETKDISQNTDNISKKPIDQKTDSNEYTNHPSETSDLSEYLKTLSVFNMDSGQSENKEDDSH